MSAPDEKELIARVVASGELRAFEELVKLHEHAVRNWLRRLESNWAQVEDLAQETFLQAWTKIDTFDFKGEFRSWLFSIAYREFLQAARTSKRNRSLLERFGLLATDTQHLQEEAAYENSDLAKLLSTLSRDEKACMILGNGFGHSNTEISEITGIPLGTVKSHIRRATMKIQSKFKLKD